MLKKLSQLFLRFILGLKSVIPVLLIIIFILLNVAIWWAGPWLEINGSYPLEPLTNRLIASVLLTLLFIAVWGVIQWHQLKKIRASQQKEEWLLQDPINRLEEQQEKYLNQIITAMKKNYTKSNFLYALPWYLVLGVEQAGKTSLINRSGQNFIFSTVLKAAGQKKKNPYNFDWWISDESVLIDPDGELLTQYDTPPGEQAIKQRLWLNFIKWLDNTRSRRPLNGVVLVVNIAQLAEASNSQRLEMASLMRARLRDLMEQLSTRLPVYITLTKLDLLYGFEPFFRHYTRAEREEVLGFTFSLSSVNELDEWLTEFNDNYSQFIQRINQLLPNALMQCFDEREKTALYSFSRQLAGLQPVLSQFFTHALASDQFSTSALVRGVYFSSVYQQGVPTDVFVNNAAARYALPEQVNSAQNASSSTTYFTHSLFTKIIYPEAGLASDNFRVAKNKRKILMLSTIACGIGGILMIIGWQHYYKQNSQQAENVLAKVNSYKDRYGTEIALGTEQDLLGPLNTIGDATLEFGYFRQKPWLISDMGLYQGHYIGPKVESTYLHLLEMRFLPALLKEVAADLAEAKTDEDQLAILRVFRMLTDKSGRYRNFVQDYFAKLWQKRYSGDRPTQEKLAQHLQYVMMNTDLHGKRIKGDAEAEMILQPYDQLIATSQEHLSRIPIEQWVYLNIKQQSTYQLGAPFNINTAIGPVFDVVFNDRLSEQHYLQIPRVLTKKGYEDYFVRQAEAISDLVLVDTWVLGQTTSIDFSEEDKKALREKVRELYVTDYTESWRDALKAIEIKSFVDLNGAVLVLESITGNMQPLHRLLSIVTDNTQLFPPLPADDKARLELTRSPRFQVAASIEKEFHDLSELIRRKENEPAYMVEVTEAIGQLQGYLKSISIAPDVGKAAFDATKSRVTLSNADPIYVLQRIAANLPAPMDEMVRKIADQSWYVIRQEAVRHLEVRWRNEVYAEFQEKLHSRYPFNPQAKKDVALRDFEQFFAPGNGTLASFYENNLKLFFEEGLLYDGMDQNQSLIRDEVLSQLEQAKAIQHAFFNRKGVLDISFVLEPLEMSSNKRRSVLNIDGQYVEYSNGPRKVTELVWPNTLRESVMSGITLVPAGSNLSPRSLTMQGAWSFFRLLNESEVVAISPTTVDYKFKLDGGEITYRVHSEADINPFTAALFKDFYLPDLLY